MEITNQPNHFHNPYSLPFLAFIPDHYNLSNDFIDHELLESSDLSINSEEIDVLTFVELHTQTVSPVEFIRQIFPIALIFTTSSFYAQMQTLSMLRQENSVNNKMMVTQAKLHMIFWPMSVIGGMLTDNIYPLTAYVPIQVCHIWSFLVEFGSLSIILYSFYAALLRYIMLMHTKRAETFGKERLISMIYWIFYFHAFLWALFIKFIRFNMESLPMVNKCYGWMDRVYLVELHDSTNMMKRHFCAFDDSNDGKIVFQLYTFGSFYKNI